MRGAAAIAVSPAGLDVGTVVLKRMLQSNGTLQVWSDAEKGSANAVVTDNESHSWDLADPDDASHFAAVHDGLHVEGIDWPAESGTGSGTLVAELRDPSGALICSDNVAYTLMAALCDRQPKPDERDLACDVFPNLIHCEWSITGEATDEYNCIAWSVGEDSVSYDAWDIDHVFGDGDGVLTDYDHDCFYAAKGLSLITNGTKEEKAQQAQAAYYSFGVPWYYVVHPDPPGPGGHAARRKSCECGGGRWIMYESKCGDWVRMEHVWDQMNCPGYGEPDRFYK